MAIWNKKTQDRIDKGYEELKRYYNDEYSKRHDQLKDEYTKACLEYTSNVSNANVLQLLALKEKIFELRDLLKDFGKVEDINAVDEFVFNAAIRHYAGGKESLDVQKTKLPLFGGKNRAEEVDKDYNMKRLEFEQDLKSLETAVSCIKRTEEVSEKYVLTVTTLIDAINTILPKLGQIKAYIYADTFRLKIKNGINNFDNECKPNIGDYKDKQCQYYDFILQALDYYEIALAHYKNPVLSNTVDPIKKSESIKEASNNI